MESSTAVDRTDTVEERSKGDEAAEPVAPTSPAARDYDADRRLGIRVISCVLTLCVVVAGWGTVRAVRNVGHASTATVHRPKPFAFPVLPPPQLAQVVPDSFTIPGIAPGIPWPDSGQSAVEIEGVGSLGTSGDVGTPVPIASVTKTMTAYLILADHPLADGESGPGITVSSSDAAAYASELSQGQSLVKVYAGEQLSERQALEALMLASADNVAKILARWDAGSVPAFVDSMNRAARRLGMTRTTYTDPSGLDPSTVSTATDQIKLAETAMQSAAFRSIVGLQTADIPAEGTIFNFNRLVGIDGVIGVKTGSTDSAGGCLLFAAVTTVGGQAETVIGAVLGQPLGSGNNFLSTTLDVASKMIGAARRSVAAVTIATPGTLVASVQRPGTGLATRLGVASAVTVVGRPGETYRVLVSGDPSTATLEVTSTGGGGPSNGAGASGTESSISTPLVSLGTRGAAAAE